MKTAYLDTGTWAEDKGRSFWKLFIGCVFKRTKLQSYSERIYCSADADYFHCRATILFFGTFNEGISTICQSFE
jgi:hypothetical protein